MRHSVHSIFFDQADAHEAAGRYDQALALLYQVHRWAPDDAALWLRMGVLSFRIADREWLVAAGLEGTHHGDMGAINADVYCQRAADLAPADARGPFWRGWTRFVRFQDPGAARAHLTEAVRRQPGWPYAHAALARLEMNEAEPGWAGRALAALGVALNALPESARFHYDRGSCLIELGEPAAAREAFRQSLACPPLPGGPGAGAAYLAEAFHGDPRALAPLIAAVCPDLA